MYYNPKEDFYAKFIFDYTSRTKLVKWGLCDELGVALESGKGAAKRKNCHVRSKPTGNEVKGKYGVTRRRTVSSIHHDESMAEDGKATEHMNAKGTGKTKELTAPKRRLAEGGGAEVGDEENTLPKRRDRTVRGQTTGGGGRDGRAKEKEQQKQDESSDSMGDGDTVMDEPVPATEDTSIRVKRSLRSNKQRGSEAKAAEGEVDDDAEVSDMTPTNAVALDHGGSDRRARLRPRK
jgi:hypothetical protein